MHQTGLINVLAVDTAEGYSAGLEQVPVALDSLRTRLIELAGRLDDDDWKRSSRCELWTAHDVIRHVRDACRLHAARLGGETKSPFEEGFDSRQTPLRWLEQSAAETPQETIDDLAALCAREAEGLRLRLANYRDDVEPGPYGPVHWTVLTTHVFWDAWLHERDISQPLGLASCSTPPEERVIALYSLLIASVPAVVIGHKFEVTVALSCEDRTYLATVVPGRVSLRSDEAPGPADLWGDLSAVADSLTGRGAPVEEVLFGEPAVREPFTWLRPILASATDERPGTEGG